MGLDGTHESVVQNEFAGYTLSGLVGTYERGCGVDYGDDLVPEPGVDHHQAGTGWCV